MPHTSKSPGRATTRGRAAVKTSPEKASRGRLGEYRRKRDFKSTAEPRPRLPRGTRRQRGTHVQPSFVVQEHHARRLHWDFRLEANSVLKSWAVTKEPTLDPAIKRLAVHVEDHPLEYASFHGEIPEGEYGAGQVEIWDNGTYEPSGDVAAGVQAGKVEVNLHGQKLKGRFVLVRMGPPGKKENWLLIKMKDEFARGGSAHDGKPDSGQPLRRRRAARPAKVVVGAIGEPQRVTFTNVHKMMFPQAHVTKGDILQYYLEIAGHLLPHLKDRPMTLERLPDGLANPGAPRFWQKNTPAYYPQWIPRVKLNHDGKPVQYPLVNDANTLAYLVNQGAITFHPFLSRVQSLNHPDFVLFDLDPGEAAFTDAVKIALKLHELLEEAKVEMFIKTSGKSGLHLLVPWDMPGGYDEARQWAAPFAQRAVQSLPQIATMERTKAARRGRVYIDLMQNAQGKHAVPPYVVRAVPLATVSTPLQWDEVNSTLDPAKFTMKAVLKRAQGGDTMAKLTGNTDA